MKESERTSRTFQKSPRLILIFSKVVVFVAGEEGPEAEGYQHGEVAEDLDGDVRIAGHDGLVSECVDSQEENHGDVEVEVEEEHLLDVRTPLVLGHGLDYFVFEDGVLLGGAAGLDDGAEEGGIWGGDVLDGDELGRDGQALWGWGGGLNLWWLG